MSKLSPNILSHNFNTLKFRLVTQNEKTSTFKILLSEKYRNSRNFWSDVVDNKKTKLIQTEMFRRDPGNCSVDIFFQIKNGGMSILKYNISKLALAKVTATEIRI